MSLDEDSRLIIKKLSLKADKFSTLIIEVSGDIAPFSISNQVYQTLCVISGVVRDDNLSVMTLNGVPVELDASNSGEYAFLILDQVDVNGANIAALQAIDFAGNHHMVEDSQQY